MKPGRPSREARKQIALETLRLALNLGFVGQAEVVESVGLSSAASANSRLTSLTVLGYLERVYVPGRSPWKWRLTPKGRRALRRGSVRFDRRTVVRMRDRRVEVARHRVEVTEKRIEGTEERLGGLRGRLEGEVSEYENRKEEAA